MLFNLLKLLNDCSNKAINCSFEISPIDCLLKEEYNLPYSLVSINVKISFIFFSISSEGLLSNVSLEEPLSLTWFSTALDVLTLLFSDDEFVHADVKETKITKSKIVKTNALRSRYTRPSLVVHRQPEN